MNGMRRGHIDHTLRLRPPGEHPAQPRDEGHRRELSAEVQWVPLNIIPSVHEKIMTLSGIFYYPMYGSYRGYRGTIGPV